MSRQTIVGAMSSDGWLFPTGAFRPRYLYSFPPDQSKPKAFLCRRWRHSLSVEKMFDDNKGVSNVLSSATATGGSSPNPSSSRDDDIPTFESSAVDILNIFYFSDLLLIDLSRSRGASKSFPPSLCKS